MKPELNVPQWIRSITESVMGGSPVEVGNFYEHPEDGLIEITRGQYWGRDGLSNHWHWTVLATGEIKSGYADAWPEVKMDQG